MKSMNLFGGNDKSSEELFGDSKPKKKTYSENFKKKAVKLASGIGVAKAAEELGVSTNSIYSWKKNLEEKPLAKSLSPAPIQDKDGNLTFELEGKTYSLNVNSKEERERVKKEVNANSLTQYDWFKEETGENHWVFYNTKMYEVVYDRLSCTNYLHYKENSDLNPIIPINATSCFKMFYDCYTLTQLDLSRFNTKNVVDMGSMFSCCKALTQLDLSNFDTSKVTKMCYMFYDCEALTQLDLSNFSTNSVTNMSGMFNFCEALTYLYLSNFDTSSVTDMSNMFAYCKSLIKLNLCKFDTSNVASSENMFYYCESLETIYISYKWSLDIYPCPRALL